MHRPEKSQPSLFEKEEPSIELTPALKAQLMPQVEALLGEIADALATREAGDEQDHG